MKTNELIEKLKKDLKPKRALLSPELRFGLWLLVSAGIIFFSLNHFTIRADIIGKLGAGRYWVEMAVMLGLIISGGLSAFYLAIPGEKPIKLRRLFKWLSFAQLFSVAGWFLANLIHHHPFNFDFGYMCAVIVSITALLPTLGICVAILRGAPVHQSAALQAAATSGATAGLIAIQLICSENGAGHSLIWHFTPFIGIAAISWLLGKIVIQRQNQQHRLQ